LKIDRKYNLDGAYEAGNPKKEIQHKILERAQIEWERGLEKKSTLVLYRNKKQPKKEDIYDGSWSSYSSSLLFKARSGSIEVNARTYRWNGVGDRCLWCDLGEKETLGHMMVECMGHTQERELFLRTIRQVLGEECLESIIEREDYGMSVLLGFESDCEELKHMRRQIVARTKIYLMSLWRKRV
jgi:hypothetical protein